jgi:hypothetical protein
MTTYSATLIMVIYRYLKTFEVFKPNSKWIPTVPKNNILQRIGSQAEVALF